MVMLENGVIPIVNEKWYHFGDGTDVSDNDELSGMIASMMDMQALIILSNIDGVLWRLAFCSRCPGHQRGWSRGKDPVRLYPGGEIGFRQGRHADQDDHCPQSGGWGYYSRHHSQREEGQYIGGLAAAPEETVCTRFVPATDGVSSVKKWIAHSEGFAKGELHLNEPAVKVLKGNKAVSLLSGRHRCYRRWIWERWYRENHRPSKANRSGTWGFDSEEARLLMGATRSKAGGALWLSVFGLINFDCNGKTGWYFSAGAGSRQESGFLWGGKIMKYCVPWRMPRNREAGQILNGECQGPGKDGWVWPEVWQVEADDGT